MFEVIVKETFFASHSLRNYHGMDEAVHDHQWTIEAKFTSPMVDDSGCAIDFREIDLIFQEILTPFQGTTLNNLDYFKSVSPSAENIACFVYERVTKMLKGKAARLASITAWEDDDHGATYSLP